MLAGLIERMRHHSELHGPSWCAAGKFALGTFGLFLGFRYLSLNWAVSYSEYLFTAIAVPLALGGFTYLVQKSVAELLRSVAGLDLRRVGAAAHSIVSSEREDRLCSAILFSLEVEARGEPGDGAKWMQAFIAGNHAAAADLESAIAEFRSLGVLPSLQKPTQASHEMQPMPVLGTPSQISG